MQYIIILGAFQALVTLCLFFVNRQRKPADNLLTCILICIFTHLSIKFVIYAVSGNIALQNAFNTFIDLAYGPLLWMYARKVKNDRYRPLQHWYLLLPTLMAGIVYMVIATKIMNNPAGATPLLALYNDVTQYLIIASVTVYPFLCLQICKELPAFWESEQKLIKKIATCFLIIPALWMLTNIILRVHLLSGQTVNIGIRLIAYTNMLVICLFILQYRLEARALNKEVLPEPLPPALPHTPAPALLMEEKETLVVTVQEGPQAKKSVLSPQQQAAIAQKLSALMEEKKVFTDPELTLEKLASQIKVPRHHISEVLNQYLHKTFYQYINDYRMQEVLHLMDYCKKQAVNPNILSLAFDAGFNSKSSFNQYFKKITGLTPTEYFKQHANTGPMEIASTFITLQPSVQPN
jgi:AraC-like DNA-binding protein